MPFNQPTNKSVNRPVNFVSLSNQATKTIKTPKTRIENRAKIELSSASIALSKERKQYIVAANLQENTNGTICRPPQAGRVGGCYFLDPVPLVRASGLRCKILSAIFSYFA